MNDIFIRAARNLLTLYMLLILVRWVASWIEFDMMAPRWRWIPRLTDPLIDLMRRLLPSMGPMDFGPIAALFLVWLVRLLSWNLLLSVQFGQ